LPPISNGFIANVYATFMKKVFHISQREWKPCIQQNCELDDLKTDFKIAVGYWFRHR
jgi:hypothetical protein